MKSICVYLGANSGNNKKFNTAVVTLGTEIAEMGLTLVYGGSSQGTMGLLATTVKEHGGRVIGVIPKHLIEKEKPLTILDELYVVDSMQERKQLMQEKAEAFLVMPGGLGTLEEAFETWNAIKIGLFEKPIGFLNLDGYFDHLFKFISQCEESGFVTKESIQIPKINPNVQGLLSELSHKKDEVYQSRPFAMV